MIHNVKVGHSKWPRNLKQSSTWFDVSQVNSKSKNQEDCFKFFGLLRKHKLYKILIQSLNCYRGRQLSFILHIFSDIEVELIRTCKTLEDLDLEENPLSRDCQDRLSSVTNLRVLVTHREIEEWEDLSI